MVGLGIKQKNDWKPNLNKIKALVSILVIKEKMATHCLDGGYSSSEHALVNKMKFIMKRIIKAWILFTYLKNGIYMYNKKNNV